MYSATATQPPITTRSLSLRLLRTRLVSLPVRARKSLTTTMSTAGDHAKKAEEHASKAAEAMGTHTKEQAKTFAEKVRAWNQSQGCCGAKVDPMYWASQRQRWCCKPRRARVRG